MVEVLSDCEWYIIEIVILLVRCMQIVLEVCRRVVWGIIVILRYL